MKLEINITNKNSIDAWKTAKKNLKKLKKVFTPEILKKIENEEEDALDSLTEKQALNYLDTSAALLFLFITNEVKETDDKKNTRKKKSEDQHHTYDCNDLTSYWNR